MMARRRAAILCTAVFVVTLLLLLHRYRKGEVFIGGIQSMRNNLKIDRSSAMRCSAKMNIVFLKTHKTAGSTVQNILLRYGLEKNLTFALPAAGHRFYWPDYFKRSSVLQEQQNRSKTVYNILCHHARFHYANMRDLMPEDSLYITVVRSPAAMFRSAFEYFHLRKKYNIFQPHAMDVFLSRPSYYVGPYGKRPFFRNPIFFDLGYSPDQLVSEKLINEAIEYINGIFSVVLVSDHFEESMVLLRHTLCWDLNDVTHFKLNAMKTSSTKYVSTETEAKIKQWNKADSMLFDYFNKSLWQKLSKLPFDWIREVKTIKQKNRLLHVKCSNIKTKDLKLLAPPGLSVDGNVLKELEQRKKACVYMAKPEIQFTQELKRKYKNYIKK
ncbi:galactosylceramide sulfotransferase-like [Branchiostoma floridae x Branchiostoma belcheri]